MKTNRNSICIDVILYALVMIALIILKVENVIQWNWLWVLSPVWLPFAVSFVILVIIFLWTIVEGKVKKDGK